MGGKSGEEPKRRSICDMLTADLEHYRMERQLRPDTAPVSREYDAFFEEVMGWKGKSPIKQAARAADIIRDAFCLGYKVDSYVERLRQFCEEKGV
jgi:hypothetical protein